MKSVRELLHEFRSDLQKKAVDELIDNGDFLERAEWNTRDRTLSDVDFYKRSRFYVYNHVQAEEARIENGDLERFASCFPKNKFENALDFGAGVGTVLQYLTNHAHFEIENKYFLEINRHTRDFLHYRLDEEDEGWFRKTHSHLGLFADLVGRQKLDLVTAYAVFEHMNYKELFNALRDIYHVLKPSGTLVMLNYHDTFDGEWPMHYVMDSDRKTLFEDFASDRTLIDVPWTFAEGIKS